MQKKDKFYIGENFRKSHLSKKHSPITAEVHEPGQSIKAYTNVHYPNAFAKKVFKENNSVTHIVFKDSSGGNDITIENPNK